MSGPFPPPPGKRWVFCASYVHWRSKKRLWARDYGKQCWCFLVWARKK